MCEEGEPCTERRPSETKSEEAKFLHFIRTTPQHWTPPRLTSNSHRSTRRRTTASASMFSGKNYEEIGPGWLYLYDEGEKIWHEYSVEWPGAGAAVYRNIQWGSGPAPDYREPTGEPTTLVEVRKGSKYRVAFSTVQWSRRRIELLEDPQARKQRMQPINQSSMIGKTQLQNMIADARVVIARADGEAAGGVWKAHLVADPVSTLLKLAGNYLRARETMSRWVKRSQTEKWYEAAMAVNPLRGPTMADYQDQLDGLNNSLLDDIFLVTPRAGLRYTIGLLKFMLVGELSSEALKKTNKSLVPAIHDYCLLPAEKVAAEASDYSALWELGSAIFASIADPVYSQDLIHESDPEPLKEMDNSGREDPGLILLNELTDPDKDHPLRNLFFPPLPGVETERVEVNFNPEKLDALTASQNWEGVYKTIFMFVSQFENQGRSFLDLKKSVVIELIRYVKINISVRMVEIGILVDSERIVPGVRVTPPRHTSLYAKQKIQAVVIEDHKLSKWASRNEKLIKGAGNVLAMFEAWNFAAAVNKVVNSSEGSMGEKAAAIAQLSEATAVVMQRYATFSQSSPTLAAKGLGGSKLVRALASKGFARVTMGIGVVTSVLDMVNSANAGDHDAAVGAGIAAVGGVVAIVGGMAAVPVVGWIGAGLTIIGTLIYIWCSDTKLESWVAKGPFSKTWPERTCRDSNWDKSPKRVIAAFFEGMCTVRAQAKPSRYAGYRNCKRCAGRCIYSRLKKVGNITYIEILVPSWLSRGASIEYKIVWQEDNLFIDKDLSSVYVTREMRDLEMSESGSFVLPLKIPNNIPIGMDFEFEVEICFHLFDRRIRVPNEPGSFLTTDASDRRR